MVNKKCALLLLTLFIFCIGSVCATEPDNIIADFDSSSSDVSCSDNLNNYNLCSDVIYDDNNDCVDYNECYINASDFTLNYGISSMYSVHVYDHNGNPVNEGVVEVVMDDHYKSCLGSVINGKADMFVCPKCKVGTHKVIVYYYPDSSFLFKDDDQYDEVQGHYWSHNTTVNFNVVKSNGYIDTYKSTAYYKSDDYFMFGVVHSDMGKIEYVNKCKVDVYTGKHKKTYYIQSDYSGCTYMFLSADKVAIGSHKVIVSVCDPNVKAKPITTTITLKKAKTKVSAPKVRNFYKSKKYFKVTVKNSLTGKPISNLKLKLTVYTGKKHKNYHVKTNSKGVAKLSTKYLKIGPHKVLINSANSKYSVKSKSSIIIKKKVIKSTIVKFSSYSKSIGGRDCIYTQYDPPYSPMDECSRGTHIELGNIDGNGPDPYCHLLGEVKIYFKNKKGKIITKTYKSDGYGIFKIAPKGYVPYKAKVYYYHT